MKEKNIFDSAWIIVGISFIILALSYGVWYSFSLFFVALLGEFGWSRSVAAGAFSIFIILHSLIGPFVGSMVGRFGPRRVILIGSLFLGIGLALSSLVQTWWQFYISFGVITALGIGATGWISNTTLIQSWFKENRGLAMGIISSGIGTGILICVPFFQLLITRFGWRMTYRIMAFFIPLLIGCMVTIFLRRPPPSPSFPPTEMGNSQGRIDDPFVVNREWVSQSWTVKRAITTKAFWFLSFVCFLSNFMNQSIFTHHVAFFVDHGLENLVVSYIIGITGLVSIGGKILWGILSDQIGRELTYTIGLACFICGMIFLIAFDLFPSSSLPYLYAVFFSLGYAVMAVLPPLITADFFEGNAYGSIFGTLMLLNGAGGALGAWFAGFLYDQVGSYLFVFFVMIVSSVLSFFSIWWAAPRKIRMVPGKRFKMKSI
jgi:MFS family permease